MNPKLMEVLACPICKGKLHFNEENTELVCRFDRLAFPVKEGIPVMLPGEARELSSDELDALK